MNPLEEKISQILGKSTIEKIFNSGIIESTEYLSTKAIAGINERVSISIREYQRQSLIGSKILHEMC